MTQNYLYAFLQEDTNSQIKWNEYISGTVIGRWGNQIIPKVSAPGRKAIELAYIKDCLFHVSIEVDIPDQQRGSLAESNPRENKLGICKWLIDQKKIVEVVALVMSFFTGEVNIFIKESNKSEGKLLLNLSGAKCTFDILGFTINSMSGSVYTEKIKDILLATLEKFVGSDDCRESLEGKLEKSSMMCEYESWYKKYTGAVLPIYSLDIMYNILKRVKKKMRKMFPREIEQKDCLPVLQSFYKALGDSLTEEDMFYGKRIEENTIREEVQYTDFYSAFLENPFVQYFVKRKPVEQDIISDKKSIVRPGPTEEQPKEKLPGLFVQLFDGLLDSLLGN